MILMEYSGARGTLIHEKKLKTKILCQTPFKARTPYETEPKRKNSPQFGAAR
jgi:hypothetical protein